MKLKRTKFKCGEKVNFSESKEIIKVDACNKIYVDNIEHLACYSGTSIDKKMHLKGYLYGTSKLIDCIDYIIVCNLTDKAIENKLSYIKGLCKHLDTVGKVKQLMHFVEDNCPSFSYFERK